MKEINVKFHLKDSEWQTLRDRIMSRISVYNLKRVSPNSKYAYTDAVSQEIASIVSDDIKTYGLHDEVRYYDSVQTMIQYEIDNLTGDKPYV